MKYFFQDFLQSTGPCVRPDKMKSPKLKEELEERGLSTTGSNEDLISRLQTDDRSKYSVLYITVLQV